jgi:hypothetical protein
VPAPGVHLGTAPKAGIVLLRGEGGEGFSIN